MQSRPRGLLRRNALPRWPSSLRRCRLTPKRKLQLASDDQCVADFGAVPGRVPPLPLRPGVRVLCDPRLCDAAVVWGSSCDARQRLFIRKPRLTLPALAAAAAAAAAAPVAAGLFAASTFEWLPPPER